MYKIEKISVNNFKNIVNTELELDDMNIIVGPNNSGKSNFLQVIPFLKRIIREDLEEIQSGFENLFKIQEYLPFNKVIGKNSVDSFIISFDLEYINTETEIKGYYGLQLKVKKLSKRNPLKVLNYKISICKENLSFKNINSTGPSKKIFNRDENSLEFGEIIQGIRKIKEVPSYASVLRFLDLISFEKSSNNLYKDAINGLNEILNSPVFYFSSFELRKNKEDNPKSFQNKRRIWIDLNKQIELLLNDKSKKEDLEVAIKNIIGIEDLRIIKHKDKDINIQQSSATFRLHNSFNAVIETLSDGSLLLLAFIVEVLSSKRDILLIEEPENSIHPKALEELIKFMKEFGSNKQFIITTHSGALLNIVNNPSKIIIADLNEDSESMFRKPNDIKALRKKLSKSFLSLGDLLYYNIDQEQKA